MPRLERVISHLMCDQKPVLEVVRTPLISSSTSVTLGEIKEHLCSLSGTSYKKYPTAVSCPDRIPLLEKRKKKRETQHPPSK